VDQRERSGSLATNQQAALRVFVEFVAHFEILLRPGEIPKINLYFLASKNDAFYAVIDPDGRYVFGYKLRAIEGRSA
jgi:hypothetical protein